MRALELILKDLKHTKEFLFTKELFFNEHALHCNCSGFITYLLKRTNRLPEALNERSRAVDYYNYISDQGAIENITELKPYDVICWRKDNVPKGGDSGHLLLLMDKPQLISPGAYNCVIMDVTKKREQGPTKREIELYCDENDTISGVRFDLEIKKVKRTPILAYRFFKRSICESCEYPLERCLCSFLGEKTKLPFDLNILRDPKEKDHPFATLPLLNLFFKDLEYENGESFLKREGTLVYPAHPDISLGPQVSLKEAKGPFILLDATWKKSKKILFNNPWLQELPRVEIEGAGSSLYTIRKQPKDDYLSTLETVYWLWKQRCSEEHEDHKDQERLRELFIEYNRLQDQFSTLSI